MDGHPFFGCMLTLVARPPFRDVDGAWSKYPKGGRARVSMQPKKGWPYIHPFAWEFISQVSMLPICLIGLHNPRLLVACSLGNLFPKQKGGLYICCTLSSWPRTAELFPPRSALPQVTTDPSSGMAAKAWTVAQSAAHPSAHLDLPNCHRQSLNYPSSRRIHLPESQQRPHLWPEPAAPSWDDIELQNRHRQGLHYVRPESAADPWSGLGLQNCRRQSLHYPSSRQIHLPELQQRPHLWPESAAHPWVHLGLPNCHPR